MALIVYGSLYPWNFVWIAPDRHPLRILVESRYFGINLFLFRDILVNIAIYVPLGAAAHLAFRRKVGRLWSLACPVLLGGLLSVSIEIAQIFQPERYTGIVDVIANVAGSAAGVLLGLVLAHRGQRTGHRTSRDNVAVALVVLWLAWLLFPVFPTLGRIVLIEKFRAFSSASLFDAVRFCTSAGAWLVAGRLLSAEGLHRPTAWLSLSVLAVPMQFFIASRRPAPADLIGALTGLALYLALRHAPRVAAAVLIGCVAIRGLAPFQWSSSDAPINWLPFGAALEANWQASAFILIEKSFFYGACVWSLQEAGAKLWVAALSMAGLLAIIELLQMHLPGRTPESTDALMPLLLAIAFSARKR